VRQTSCRNTADVTTPDVKNQACRAFGLVGQLRKRNEETKGIVFRAGVLMMSAKFRVKRSATGLGLFATEPIGKNGSFDIGASGFQTDLPDS
jgi:hypothetical protein